MPNRRPTSLSAALVLIAALTAPSSPAQSDGGLATVHLADGSSVPLTGWSLGYDHLVWAKGTPQHLAGSKVARSDQLWVDKDTYPLAGTTLELEYETPKGSRAPRVKQMFLVDASGKKKKLKPDAPHKDLMAPGAGGDLLFLARTLDLAGQTLTGTPRTFCLITYTSLVECATTPDSQVKRVDFD